MKKIGSILFLLILIFNFWGYKWALSYLEQKATVRLEQKLDAGKYDMSQLVEVKIPLNLPYYNEQSEYEAFYGEVELNGQSYQYVKRKVTGDTLFLLCIQHTEKNDIKLAKSDYFKSVNNLQTDGPQKGNQPESIKLMLSEFLPNENDQVTASVQDDLSGSLNSFDISYSSQFNPLTPAQPPEC
ncbi:MAG: hypothetical protein JWM28_2676 [Chitinophagaceae bacterium]|nr:hypothetical protein [Chitinophagaceae bacterium]